MECDFSCPCGGGQSCIVSRRSLGDWVHEDDLLIDAGLPLRKNCFDKLNKKQKKVLTQMWYVEIQPAAEPPASAHTGVQTSPHLL
jgi:hypothetical protein